jgi:hypothetical protein
MALRHVGMYVVDLQLWGRAMPCLFGASQDFFSNAKVRAPQLDDLLFHG